MFSYGQKQVEMILAFVEGRCIIGYSHFTSGNESTVVCFYLDCSRTFGNCCYNTIFYCSDIRVRTAPSDSCNSCIFRNDSRSQCSCSSCFSVNVVGVIVTPVTDTFFKSSSSEQAVKPTEIRAVMKVSNANLNFFIFFLFLNMNVN